MTDARKDHWEGVLTKWIQYTIYSTKVSLICKMLIKGTVYICAISSVIIYLNILSYFDRGRGEGEIEEKWLTKNMSITKKNIKHFLQ